MSIVAKSIQNTTKMAARYFHACLCFITLLSVLIATNAQEYSITDMTLTLIDRFHPGLRRKQQAAIDAGELRKRDEIELLEPEQIRPLAMLSLVMFVVGGV